MCARSQTSGDISGECCRTRSVSSTASVSSWVRSRAVSRLPAISSRSWPSPLSAAGRGRVRGRRGCHLCSSWLMGRCVGQPDVVQVADDVRRAFRPARLVEQVVGRAAAAQHIAVGERGHRVPHLGWCAEPAQRLVGRGEALPGGRGQLRVVQPEPGGAQPQLIRGAGQRRRRGHRGLRRGRVVEQRGHHRGGHDPAVAGLRVDHPQLQVAAAAGPAGTGWSCDRPGRRRSAPGWPRRASSPGTSARTARSTGSDPGSRRHITEASST